MGPSVMQTVCDNCWTTVFSRHGFQAAWDAQTHSETEPAPAGFTYTTPSWAEMQRSINRLCEWCDLISEELQFYHRAQTRDPEPPADTTFCVRVWFATQPDRPLSLRMSVNDSWETSWYVHTSASDPAARHISERGTLDRLDSPEAMSLALDRIRHCLSTHPRCAPRQSPTRRPTRLVDCTDPSHPRIVITADHNIDKHYVALSYVWGEDQPHRTTLARLASYTDAIDTALIPATIRDAILVTRSLGLFHLWVDSLCIIQDSPEDKAVEIANMRNIFRGAHLTIVAASAKRVTDGFLRPRLLFNTPSTLPFRCPGSGDEVGTMYVQEFTYAPHEPVNTRAWCFEERVLSARKLWYCSHTLQYECRTEHGNVDGTVNMSGPLDGVPSLPDCVFTEAGVEAEAEAEAGNETNADADGDTVTQAWQSILQLYTKRSLTRPGDRLLALSGVIGYFAKHWHTSSYTAGLWTHQLPHCLMWSRTGSGRSPRPEKYRAPSWSWAAVDGGISTEFCDISSGTSLCVVRECSALSRWPVNPYGQVKTGRLVIELVLRLVIWNVVDDELFEVDGRLGVAWSHNENMYPDHGEVGYTSADAADDDDLSSPTCEVTAAVLMHNSEGALGGLLLVPVDGDGNLDAMPTYRRVGQFNGTFCDREVWMAATPQLIQII